MNTVYLLMACYYEYENTLLGVFVGEAAARKFYHQWKYDGNSCDDYIIKEEVIRE